MPDQIETIPAPFVARPEITLQAENTIICEANIEGISDIRYYWYADGYPLAYGTDGSYTLETVQKVGRGRVPYDFGAGQGASAAPISAEISAKRATQASAKSDATRRARTHWGVWLCWPLGYSPLRGCFADAFRHRPSGCLWQTVSFLSALASALPFAPMRSRATLPTYWKVS